MTEDDLRAAVVAERGLAQPDVGGTGEGARKLQSHGRPVRAPRRRQVAARDAARVAAGQRRNPWTPPGGGVHGALSHDVIHGLDITVGLGLNRQVPPERVAMVLAGMRPKNIAFFGTDLAGVALQATDLDWSYGTGTPVRSLAQDLLLALCGRRLPPGRLKGEAATRFSQVAL